MENKEIETWLKETKAKNLTEIQIYELLDSEYNVSEKDYLALKRIFKVENQTDLSKALFNQWQKEAEFSPKRGDRVLVYNNGGDEENRIFVAKIENAVKPIIYVLPMDEQKFLNNKQFRVTNRDFMKPLPTENTTETDFKTKVIEYLEKRIKSHYDKTIEAKNANNFTNASFFSSYKSEAQEILEQIKDLN